MMGHLAAKLVIMAQESLLVIEKMTVVLLKYSDINMEYKVLERYTRTITSGQTKAVHRYR